MNSKRLKETRVLTKQTIENRSLIALTTCLTSKGFRKSSELRVLMLILRSRNQMCLRELRHRQGIETQGFELLDLKELRRLNWTLMRNLTLLRRRRRMGRGSTQARTPSHLLTQRHRLFIEMESENGDRSTEIPSTRKPHLTSKQSPRPA